MTSYAVSRGHPAPLVGKRFLAGGFRVYFCLVFMQTEWQRGGICGALSSTSQQLNIEPSEQRERERVFMPCLH